jgi:hypothetical protein
MFNPLDSVKNFINQSANSISDSYNKVSVDVVKAVTPIIESVKPNVTTQTIQPSQTVQSAEPIKLAEPVQPTQNSTPELVPFEKKFESLYVGCYEDDPLNPSMSTLLGNVSNISECIDLGIKNNFSYIGLRGGNECFASNDIPKTLSVNRSKFCNVGCDEIGTGNCGGFFYNQVYKTSTPNNSNNSNNLNNSNNSNDTLSNNELEKEIVSNTVNVLENFISSDSDIKKISLGLDNNNFNCWKPMNTYFIFFWLVILLFLIYLLFEYLYKKNNK